MTAARDRQTALVRPIGITVRRPTVRPHPSLGCVLWTVDDSANATTTSACAGQSLCGAPRRNRTGDPILTMEPPGTAVRTAVSPGHARPSGQSYRFSFHEVMRSLLGHAVRDRRELSQRAISEPTRCPLLGRPFV